MHPDNTVTLYDSIVDTATSPAVGTSSASAGLLNGGISVRPAAATAYQALLALAATNLGVSATNLTVKNGVVSGGGKSVTYGQLIGGQLINASIPASTIAARAAEPGDPGPVHALGRARL